jgi:hypothetical protein
MRVSLVVVVHAVTVLFNAAQYMLTRRFVLCTYVPYRHACDSAADRHKLLSCERYQVWHI